MRQIIILCIAFLVCISSVQALRTDSLAAQLLAKEIQFWRATSPKEKSNIRYAKMQLYLSTHKEVEKQCLDETNQIDPSLLDTSLRVTYFWNAALINLLHQHYANAASCIEMYRLLSKDTSDACYLVMVLANHLNPTSTLTNANLSPEVLEVYTCLQQEEAILNPKTYKPFFLSYLLPGSGMIAKGYYDKGATSLALNALGASLVYALWKSNLYINAIAYAFLVTIKLYQGSIAYTKKLVPKKLHKQQVQEMNICKQKLAALLIRQPLELKR